MLLFVAPEPGLPPKVQEGIRDFLSRGNCVVIASESEEDSDLLRGAGSSIRIRNASIVSVDRFFDDPSSVIAFPAGDDPLSAGISRLVLNDPSYLEGGDPVFTTSLLSFADTDGDLHLGKGEALERLGRERGDFSLYEKAVACFDIVLQEEPENVNAWNYRGVCLKELGRFEEARRSFDKAQTLLRMNPRTLSH